MRYKGEHVIGLARPSSEVILHEVAHTVNAYFPVQEARESQKNVLTRIAMGSEVNSTNSMVVRAVEEACSYLATDILNKEGELPYPVNEHNQIADYISDNPDMKLPLHSIVDGIPRDPAEFIAFMDEFNNLCTLIWDKKVEDDYLVMLFGELIEGNYTEIIESLSSVFPDLKDKPGFNAIGQRETNYNTAPKAGLNIDYRQINQALDRILNKE